MSACVDCGGGGCATCNGGHLECSGCEARLADTSLDEGRDHDHGFCVVCQYARVSEREIGLRSFNAREAQMRELETRILRQITEGRESDARQIVRDLLTCGVYEGAQAARRRTA